MKIKSPVFLISAVTLTSVFLGAAAYSPYLIYEKLNTAVKDLDAETFNSHVNYPSLRSNLQIEMEALLSREMKKEFNGVELDEAIVMIRKYLDDGLSNLATPKSVERHFDTEHRDVPDGMIMLYPPSYFVASDPIKQDYSGFPSVFKIVVMGRDGEPYEATFFREGFFEWKLEYFLPTGENKKWYDADGKPIKN